MITPALLRARSFHEPGAGIQHAGISEGVGGCKLGDLQTANRLANGNTVICSWIAGDNNTKHWFGTVQVFEVNPAKQMVRALAAWENPDFGPATLIQLLDEPGTPETMDQQR
jgi:hypothetical protein